MRSARGRLQLARAALLGAAGLAALAAGGCGSRDRSNPLDPLNPLTGGRLTGFTAVAGSADVTLTWDALVYATAPPVRLERALASDSAFALLADTPLALGQYLDATAQPGQDYVYRARVVTASGLTAPVLAGAQPGPERPWVADAGLDRVVLLSPDGRAVRLDLEGFIFPAGIAWDPVLRRVWVANTFGGTVVELDSSGTVVGTHTPLDFPHAVAADPVSGGCWVADDHEGVVVRLGRDGAELARATSFAGPVALAPTRDGGGGVWVAEADAGRVTLLRGDGTRVVSRPGFSLPQGLAVDPGAAGRDPGVWVADYGADQVVKLSAEGLTVFRLVGIPGPTAVDVDPGDGSAWVATARGGTGAVTRLGADGHFVWRVDGLVDPVAVAAEADPDQDVWVADAADNAVWKIGGAGTPARRLGGLGYPLGISVDRGAPAPGSPGRARLGPRRGPGIRS
ncbi:MAG TPA: hypothetical protein VMS93_02025 [Candidatus Saccharimonadales bacterium]|nr:hypothetical protein [Candidatus Saccharimonadales bacterium]